MPHPFRRSLATLLAAAMCAAGPGAWAQAPEQARVLSSTALPEGGWRVVYEYAGRQYSAWMPNAPGATLPVQVSAAVPATAPAAAVEPAVVVADAPAPSYAVATRYYLDPLAVTLTAVGVSLGVLLGGGWLHGHGGPGPRPGPMPGRF